MYDAMQLWYTHRKEIGKPLSRSMANLLFRKAGRMGPEAFHKSVEWSVECGYQGLFAEPESKNTGPLPAIGLAEKLMKKAVKDARSKKPLGSSS